jgi:hypothetical protein
VDHVDVTIGPRFLDLFSAQLYASPNKAFEELVANSWDAGARVVHVHVPTPPELATEGAAVWVLDDGESMDVEGLKGLWAVATSGKQAISPTNRRHQIGKFGIGKLSTYLLANELTYVCRAADGQIRTVSMDYRRITEHGEASKLDVPAVRLDVRLVAADELDGLLEDLNLDSGIRELLRTSLPVSRSDDDHDEFHALEDPEPELPEEQTWTLAVMRSLKPLGKSMKSGIIQRILRSALPLGHTLKVVFNETALTSTKIDIPLEKSWVLGRDDLGFKALEWREGEGDEEAVYVRQVTTIKEPHPHLVVEGIDAQITGEVRLFKESIAGGKSAEVEPSQGFRVNVLGRVINESEPSFGLPPLSGTAWSRTRVAVRADGLNSELAVNREGLREGEPLRVMQALLRGLFNMARQHWDGLQHADFPDAGEVITKSWGTVPLNPLREVVRDGLQGIGEAPGFLRVAEGADRKAIGEAFANAVESAPESVIEDVAFEALGPDGPLTLFDPALRHVIVNSEHPFAREHGESHEQQQVVRDSALADLLTDAYMLTMGLGSELVDEVRVYRDESLRLIAMVNRRTGPQLAHLLEEVTDDEDALEKILDESLEYLGLVVEPKGQSGEPEGIATAPATRGPEDDLTSYTFTYDAKSAKRGKVKTGNINAAGLTRHRKKYGADYTLVVAPDYEAGALDQEAKDNEIAPIRARDLGRLLMLTAGSGPLSAAEFREILKLRTPDKIAEKVTELEERVTRRPRASLDTFLDALESIGFAQPDALTTSVIAMRIRDATGLDFPTAGDVDRLVRGLEVMCPSLIRLVSQQSKVIMGVSPAKLREDILRQLSSLPAELSSAATKALQLGPNDDNAAA